MTVRLVAQSCHISVLRMNQTEEFAIKRIFGVIICVITWVVNDHLNIALNSGLVIINQWTYNKLITCLGKTPSTPVNEQHIK